MKVVALLALLTCSAYASPEPPPADVVPTGGPYSILLPTKAGKFPTGTVPAQFGLFPSKLVNCGKRTMGTSDMGSSFQASASFEVATDCTPTPTVVITGADLKDTTVAMDLSKCIGTQTCSKAQAKLQQVPHGQTPTDVVDANRDAYADHSEVPDLCSAATPPPLMLFSNEDGCPGADYKVTDVTTSQSAQLPLPRWIGDADRFRVHNPWSHSLKGVPPAPPLPWTNAFIKFPDPPAATDPAKFKSCTATCDRGSIVKQTMAAASWGMVLYLNGAADGFKMCFDAEHHDDDTQTPKCKQKAEIYVLLKQGVVVWPTAGNGRAALIDLRPKAIGTGKYAIEIGYGVKEKSGGMRGEFYVGNMKREYVYSDTDGYQAQSASRITFFFPSDDTLEKFGGIISKQITSGKTYVTESKAADMEDQVAKDKQDGAAIDKAGESIEDEVVEQKVPIILTTTPASVRIGSNAAAGALLLATDNASDAIYVTGKWWTWGIYIGFLVGTLVGIGTIGGIFYLLRRTVYGFWYRGMYKRYGCDASGTTGGITGVGFGKTTTGAITVQATGAGGTTAGTTAGTTGGTTGGRTKTSATTTGTSTIGI